MTEKIKIKISNEAYAELLNILKDCPEYSHIRFQYKDGCCGSSKVDVIMDNCRSGDIEERIDGLPILYDIQVVENIKEITLVYRKASFMVKTTLTKEQFKNCSTCKVGCKSSGGCSGGCSRCK